MIPRLAPLLSLPTLIALGVALSAAVSSAATAPSSGRAAASASAEDYRVAELRCEYLTEPRGIDVLQPRLSWRLESARRGAAQTGWQVLVATTSEKLAHDGDGMGLSRAGRNRYRRIVIRPRPPSAARNPDVAPIHRVRAQYDSLHGRIASAWRQTPEKFDLDVTIPPNTTASVWLPARDAGEVRAGSYQFAKRSRLPLLQPGGGGRLGCRRAQSSIGPGRSARTPAATRRVP